MSNERTSDIPQQTVRYPITSLPKMQISDSWLSCCCSEGLWGWPRSGNGLILTLLFHTECSLFLESGKLFQLVHLFQIQTHQKSNSRMFLSVSSTINMKTSVTFFPRLPAYPHSWKWRPGVVERRVWVRIHDVWCKRENLHPSSFKLSRNKMSGASFYIPHGRTDSRLQTSCRAYYSCFSRASDTSRVSQHVPLCLPPQKTSPPP